MVGQALHRARFAHTSEVWPLLSSSFAPDGVLLGTRRFLLSKRLVTVRKTKQRPELGNLLIVAPTRSGKGLLAVSQLLTWHHSVIVNDIKGDLFTQTAGFRSLLENADLTDRYLLSAWGTLTARMRPLLTETVIRSLAHSDFTPEEIITRNRPVTVYMRWKEQDLLALSPLVRLLWGSLIDELVTTYDHRAGRGCQPVMLLIDEAGRTAIPSLADHATTVVGRGISIWLAVQSLSQLEVVYGKARAQVLRDNMESQLYYRPTDVATARYVEERCGRRSAYAHQTTEQQSGHTSEGRSEQAIPLLSAHDFLRYRDHEGIGFHRSLPPFKLERMDWRQHPILQQRRSVPPPKLPILPDSANLPMLQGINRSAYIDPDR